MNKNECCVVAKQTAAEELVSYLGTIRNKVERIKDRTYEKLSPVMISPFPTTSEKLDRKGQEYPPLFNHIQAYLTEIEIYIDDINEALDRTAM